MLLINDVKKELKEIKKTFRLLPLKQRERLVHYIAQKRKHGVITIQKELMFVFSTATVLHEDTDPLFILTTNFIADYRKLPQKAEIHPLYLTCYDVQKEKVTSDFQLIVKKMHRYAEILTFLTEEEFSQLAQEIALPDTKKELKEKARRHKKVKKMALNLHKKLYKKYSFYRIQIDGFDYQPPQKDGLFSSLFKQIGDFAISLFSRQIAENEPTELSLYAEKDFDNNANEEAFQPEKNEELEYITLIKQGELSPTLLSHLIESIENSSFNIQKTDADGNTLLHVAVQKKGMENLVVALLNAKADPDKINNSGKTPVMLAYSDKMSQAMRLLTKRRQLWGNAVSHYINQEMEDKTILPINNSEFDKKFPYPLILLSDLVDTPSSVNMENKKPQAGLITHQNIPQKTKDTGIDRTA